MSGAKKANIGLLGGMFDPIHIGHLNCAEQAADSFKLDTVYFLPTALPPHKKKGAATARQRLAMTEKAVAGNLRFKVSRFEIEKKTITYSIDTVKRFTEKLGCNLYFIIGMDAFGEIHTWKSSADLLRACNFIVIPRPGWETQKTAEKIRKSLKAKKLSLKHAPKKIGARGEFLRLSKSHYAAYLCPSAEIGISSTAIRKKIMKGKSIKYLVPESVERYIISEGIYS